MQSTPTTPAQVTISYDLYRPYGDFDIDLIINVIKTNQYKKPVSRIRLLLEQGKLDEANKVKKQLPGATFSCRYTKRRCAANVTEYSGFILLDADHLTAPVLHRVVAMLPHCRFTYAFFISPSGEGLKILVRTNGTQENHRHTYHAVVDYYSSLLGIQFDVHCSDVVRLCFLSWDPNAYLNKEAEVFNTPIPLANPNPERSRRMMRKSIPPLSSLGTDTKSYLWHKAVRATNRKRCYTEGNRNNYLFLLACHCRMFGLRHDDTLYEIMRQYNFNQREIKAAVKSAYRYK